MYVYKYINYIDCMLIACGLPIDCLLACLCEHCNFLGIQLALNQKTLLSGEAPRFSAQEHSWAMGKEDNMPIHNRLNGPVGQ